MPSKHVEATDAAALVTRIVSMYHRASDEDHAQGVGWYGAARALCRRLARETGHSVDVAAGVVAALSPQCGWTRNVELARDALHGRVHGHTSNALGKVRAILSGAPIPETLNGPKTVAFYECIRTARTRAVCVDRHAAAIALGEHGAVPTRFLSLAGGYDCIANAYRVAADRLGLRPSEVQAVTWVAYRRLERGIVD